MADAYADRNVSFDLVGALRSTGHRVVTARDEGLDHAGDDVHLLSAAQRERVLLTSNAKDFRLLHDAWRRWSNAWNVSPRHHGLVVSRQTWSWQRAARELDVFLRTTPELPNALYEWFPDRGWDQRPLSTAR